MKKESNRMPPITTGPTTARERLDQDLRNDLAAPECTCPSRDFVHPDCAYGKWLAEQYRSW